MTKLFELLGTVIATACLVQIASNPRAALKDIERGPMPNLTGFDDALNGRRTDGDKRGGKPLAGSCLFAVGSGMVADCQRSKAWIRKK
jgi:hypothetical protein